MAVHEEIAQLRKKAEKLFLAMRKETPDSLQYSSLNIQYADTVSRINSLNYSLTR